MHYMFLSIFFISEPGPPSKLRFPTVTQSVVVVNWAPPEMTGGNITLYRVSYKLRDDGKSRLVIRPSLTASKRSDSIPNLSSNKFYIFEVQAHTSVGWGEKASAEIFTSRGNTSENFSASQIFWCFETIRDDPYWACGKNSLELIELSSIDKARLVKVSSCSNAGSMRDDPYWTSRKNRFELIQLSNTNKLSFV